MLLTEFNEKEFAKTMWEEGRESGQSSGYSEGRESGYHEILKVMDEINKGNDTLDKLILLGYDEELVKQVLEKKQYIDTRIVQCYKERGCDTVRVRSLQ